MRTREIIREAKSLGADASFTGRPNMRYPTTETLPRLGLCPVCLDSPVSLNGGESPLNAQEIPLAQAHYAGPLPVSQLPAFTEDEIETALSALKG